MAQGGAGSVGIELAEVHAGCEAEFGSFDRDTREHLVVTHIHGIGGIDGEVFRGEGGAGAVADLAFRIQPAENRGGVALAGEGLGLELISSEAWS